MGQAYDDSVMVPPWGQGDITQGNAATLMDNISGQHPLSPAPYHDLNAPGTRTQRDSRRYGHGDAYQETTGVSDTITHTGRRGLLLQTSVNREHTRYADGAYSYDYNVSVVSQQPRRLLGKKAG